MAQGAVKNPHKITAKKAKSFGPKTGNRVIKPKKAKLISQRNIMKKGAAGLAPMTEKNLAQKAGHLELLKGGKKEGMIGGSKRDKKP